MLNLMSTRLVGEDLQLEPIVESHRESMREAADDNRIWENTPLGGSFDIYFESLLEASDSKNQIPFAVRLRSNDAVIGATRYMDIVPEHRRLEIGGTWYNPEYWGGKTNPQTKFLMLEHVFEKAGAHRVQLLTDMLNKRSQSAIGKLGAKREGIVRDHMIVDGGRRRDSVMFSILIEEWPLVREGLQVRLAR